MYITQEYEGRMPSFMCMRVFAYLRKKAKPVSFQEFANNRCLPPPPPPLWAFNPRTSVASLSCDLEEGMLLPPPPPPLSQEELDKRKMLGPIEEEER